MGSVWYKLAKSDSLPSCSCLNPLGMPLRVTVMTMGKLDFSGKRSASAKAKKKRDAVRNKVWDPALMKWNRGYCPKKKQL